MSSTSLPGSISKSARSMCLLHNECPYKASESAVCWTFQTATGYTTARYLGRCQHRPASKPAGDICRTRIVGTFARGMGRKRLRTQPLPKVAPQHGQESDLCLTVVGQPRLCVGERCTQLGIQSQSIPFHILPWDLICIGFGADERPHCR